MNPWCVLRIIFMIPLCSRINFSNLAGSDQQHLEFYLSADFWHQAVNQLIQDEGSTALCFSESARFLDWPNSNWLTAPSFPPSFQPWKMAAIWCHLAAGGILSFEKIKHILMISHVYFSHGFKNKNFNISHQQRDKYLLVFRYKNVAEIDTSAK